MDRKDLIRLYLDAETTFEQEQELASSFRTTPPSDETEMAVYRMLEAVTPVETEPLPDSGEMFDRIVREARTRKIRLWGLSLSGVAAILVAVVFLGRKPHPSSIDTDPVEIIQQLQLISNLDPADAERYEFEPVGDGFIMKAYF